MKRVLSIDGGGIRGLIPALVLAAFEQRAWKRTSQMFDLIAGTSTGGILACMLTSPEKYSAQDIANFYVSEGPKIFRQSLVRKVKTGFNLFDEKYSNYALRVALEHYLKAGRVSEALTPILVSTYDVGNRAPFFFKTTSARESADYDFPLHDVALATAAAPTYFEPVLVGGHALIDGGVFATNTAMCAYAEARKMWPGEAILLVSIGTGDMSSPYDYRKLGGSGQLGWVKPLLDMMMQGSAMTVDYQLDQVAGDNHIRFNRRLVKASPDMDDASASNLKGLEWEAMNLIVDRSNDINQTIARLQTWNPVTY